MKSRLLFLYIFFYVFYAFYFFKPHDVKAQSQQQYIIDFWNKTPILQSRLFIFSGITELNSISVLQKQQAGVYYTNPNLNILIHYLQEGDQWLSERTFAGAYQFKTRKAAHQFIFGINFSYNIQQFFEQPISNLLHQDLHFKYKWKNKTFYQITTQWNNGISLLNAHLDVGLRVNDTIITTLTQGYHLNLNQYTTQLKIEYNLSQLIALQFFQKLTLWSSKIGVIIYYKRFQLVSEMQWHQYLGIVGNAYIFYAIL